MMRLDYGFIAFVVSQVILVLVTSLPSLVVLLLKRIFCGHEKDVKGRIVLITGAARGLGRALALQFAKCGCKVICVDINGDLNDQTVRDINETTGDPDTALGMECDVSDLTAIKNLREQVYERYGKVDILVNNAGILYGQPMPTEDEKMARNVNNVNFMSCYWMIHAFLPKMKEDNDGHIVLINSIASLTPLGDAPMYTATKYGLLGLTDAVLDDLSRSPTRSNIKFSSVHPFFIRTEGLTSVTIAPSHIAIRTETAAKLIVRGVRREYVKFSVPGNEFGYWFLALSRVLPVHVYQRMANRVYKKVMG